MGHIGNEIGSHGFQTAQLRHHLIEIQKHQIQIVMPVGGMEGRDVDGKIPMGHLLGCLCQLLHRPVIGFNDLTPGKQGQPDGDQSPIQRWDQNLDHRVPVSVFVDQRHQPNMNPRHQQ